MLKQKHSVTVQITIPIVCSFVGQKSESEKSLQMTGLHQIYNLMISSVTGSDSRRV